MKSICGIIVIGLIMSACATTNGARSVASVNNCVTRERLVTLVQVQQQAENSGMDPVDIDLAQNRCFHQAAIDALACELLRARCTYAQASSFSIMGKHEIESLREAASKRQHNITSVEQWKKFNELRWMLVDVERHF